MAEQARAAGDYEGFHDLAWRAVQTRGQRDPDLLFLLARAQSLSGRPHDALVTLRRLAQEVHVAEDITTDDDFRRVRALPGWPEVQAIIAEVNAPAAPDNPAAEPSGRASRENRSAEPSGRTNRENRSAEPSWKEVARFPVPAFSAGGLAYDAVSRRFVIGNLPERKLTIVEEGTNRAATLSGDAARFLDVRALEIDRRQGDLWVISEGARNGSDGTVSELHKLQLVSGRVLTIYTADASNGPSRFVDVAIGPGNGVLVLDGAGPGLMRPEKDGHTLARVMDLPAGTVTSLAPSDDGRTVYVAYGDRIARVDLPTRHVDRVIGGHAALEGFARLRWHKSALIGVQAADGRQRIVQLRLSREGSKVTSTRVLDVPETTVNVSAAIDLLQDEFYYLIPGASEAAIRRIRLK